MLYLIVCCINSLYDMTCTFPSSRSSGPDKGLCCGVCKQTAALRNSKSGFRCATEEPISKSVSIVGNKSVDIQYEKQQNNK